MTIKKLLHNFSSKEITEAELLLANLLKINRVHLISHAEKIVSDIMADKFKQLIKRKRRGEPLAYLLGSQPFCGLDFMVNHKVLIPRPETEWLAENAAEALAQKNFKLLVDVGTGSGCVVISILKRLTDLGLQRPPAYGIDISLGALQVARHNARAHNVKIHWRQGDLLSPLANTLKKITGNLLLTANLPYLTARDYKQMDSAVQKFEPSVALKAGGDGLKYYRRLIKFCAALPTKNFYCLWEIDPCHSQKICQLITERFPQSAVRITKDLSDCDRYISIYPSPLRP